MVEIFKELQNVLKAFFGGKRTLRTGYLFKVRNIKKYMKMDTYEFEGLM